MTYTTDFNTKPEARPDNPAAKFAVFVGGKQYRVTSQVDWLRTKTYHGIIAMIESVWEFDFDRGEWVEINFHDMLILV